MLRDKRVFLPKVSVGPNETFCARKFRFPQLFYAEDGLERWHGQFRVFGPYHARQSSRANRLTDMFERAEVLTVPNITLVYKDRSMSFKTAARTIDISEFLLPTDADEPM